MGDNGRPRGCGRIEEEFLGEGVGQNSERGFGGTVRAITGDGVQGKDGGGEYKMARER